MSSSRCIVLIGPVLSINTVMFANGLSAPKIFLSYTHFGGDWSWRSQFQYGTPKVLSLRYLNRQDLKQENVFRDCVANLLRPCSKLSVMLLCQARNSTFAPWGQHEVLLHWNGQPCAAAVAYVKTQLDKANERYGDTRITCWYFPGI